MIEATDNTTISEYNATEAALAELRKDWDVVPHTESSKDAGYKKIKEGISVVSKYRTTLEAKRKELKAPILERGKLLDAEAKRITTHLLELENPLRDAKKNIDTAEEKAKQERLEKIQTKINEVKNLPLSLQSSSSQEISEAIEKLDSLDTAEGFYELSMDAATAKNDTMARLGELLTAKITQEQEDQRRAEETAELQKQKEALEAERRELEKQRAAVNSTETSPGEEDANEFLGGGNEIAQQTQDTPFTPSDGDILNVLARHYRVDPATVIGWLSSMNFNKTTEAA